MSNILLCTEQIPLKFWDDTLHLRITDNHAPITHSHAVDGLFLVRYNYVVLHIWFVTVTKRSLNLALTAGALTFCALQVKSG